MNCKVNELLEDIYCFYFHLAEVAQDVCITKST